MSVKATSSQSAQQARKIEHKPPKVDPLTRTQFDRVDSFSRLNSKIYGHPESELIQVSMLVSRRPLLNVNVSLATNWQQPGVVVKAMAWDPKDMTRIVEWPLSKSQMK